LKSRMDHMNRTKRKPRKAVSRQEPSTDREKKVAVPLWKRPKKRVPEARHGGITLRKNELFKKMRGEVEMEVCVECVPFEGSATETWPRKTGEKTEGWRKAVSIK